jgi:hypothetical protein
MARVRLHPLFKYLRGTIKGMVFRLSHSGTVSAYLSPDMSRVEWSQDQVSHRERMAEAIAYAKVASRDPQVREIYLQMARKVFKNNRPYNMALSDYYHTRNNLLGDRFQWDVERWRTAKENSRPFGKRRKNGKRR